ncbi:PilZ domain-containing protein [Croceicoccus pelagius]
MRMLVAKVHLKSKSQERRWNVRRPLNMDADASHNGAGYTVTIHNLSEGGLMFETWGADLDVNDIIDVNIEDYGTCAAEILWSRNHCYGCRFVEPLPKAVISAAVLKSPFLDTSEGIEESPVRLISALDEYEKPLAMANLSTGSLIILLLLGVAVWAFIYALFTLAVG